MQVTKRIDDGGTTFGGWQKWNWGSSGDVFLSALTSPDLERWWDLPVCMPRHSASRHAPVTWYRPWRQALPPNLSVTVKFTFQLQRFWHWTCKGCAQWPAWVTENVIKNIVLWCKVSTMKRKLPDMFNRDVYLIDNFQKLRKLESDAKVRHSS